MEVKLSEIQPYNIVYGMDKIFKKKAEKIQEVTPEIQEIANRMVKTMYFEQAVGIGANMVGILQNIIVVDTRENGENNLYVMINPEIISKSDEIQKFEEASLSFPGIVADIQRPRKIKVKYQDLEGKYQELEADGFLSSVIQHEMDYLIGKTYLDHLSKMKRDTLIRKMEKHIRLHPPHVHGAGCSH